MEQRSSISRTPLIAAPNEKRPAPLMRALLLALLLSAGAADAGEIVQPDCRIDHGPCMNKVRDFTVTFELSPKPVKVMRELAFSVTVTEKGAVVNDASISVSLTMPGMVMGTNTVILRSVGNGRYEGKGVIVRCPTGQKVWKAAVAVRRGNRTLSAPFLFEVH